MIHDSVTVNDVTLSKSNGENSRRDLSHKAQ